MKKIIIVFVLLMSINSLCAQQKANLTIYAPVLAPDDTLELYVQDERIVESFRSPSYLVTANNKEGKFEFEIPLNKHFAWINLNLSFQKKAKTPLSYLMDEFLLEAGDHVEIYLTPKKGHYRSVEVGYDGDIPIIMESWDARFSGIDSAKYQAQWDIKLLSESGTQLAFLKSPVTDKGFNRTAASDRLEEAAIRILDRYKSSITPLAYRLLTLQVKGGFGADLARHLDELRHNSIGRANEGEIGIAIDQYLELRAKDLNDAISSDALSPRYMEYLAQYAWLALSKKNEKRNVRLWYDYAKKTVNSSLVRDRVLSYILLNRFQHNPEQELLEDALATIKDVFALGQVSILKNLLKGKEAFAFRLPDVDGAYHELSDFRDKVVFMDFWYAACTPCRQYMMNVVAPVKEHYKDNPKVVFITVSTDDYNTFSKMVARADFLPKNGLHLYTDNKRFRSPIIDHYKIRAYPYPLLIDRDGLLVTAKDGLGTMQGLINTIEAILVD